MRNIINYSTIIFSFALAASFLSSTLAIDLKLKNYNESLIGFSLSFFALGVIVSSFLHNIIREKYSLFFTFIFSIQHFHYCDYYICHGIYKSYQFFDN